MRNIYLSNRFEFFTTHRGVYNFVDPPPASPASDQEPQPMVPLPRGLQSGELKLMGPQPMKPRPRDISLYESLGI